MEQFVDNFPNEEAHLTGEMIHKRLDEIEQIHTLTPVLAMLNDCDTQSLPSKQLNSIDIRPTSTVQVTTVC